MALVRKVHLDAWMSVRRRAWEAARGDDDLDLALEFRQNGRHEIGSLGLLEHPLERQSLQQFARARGLPDGVQQLAAPHDALGHDRGDCRVAIETQDESALRPVLDPRVRQDGLARNMHGGAVEGGLPVARKRGEEIADPSRLDDLARGRPQNAVDAQVVVRRRPVGRRAAPRHEGGERVDEPLFAPVSVHEDADDEEELVPRGHAIGQPGLMHGRRGGEGLAPLGGLRGGDDGRGDVGAGVGLPVAIARPLRPFDIERHRQSDGVTRHPHAKRALSGRRSARRHRPLAR